MKTKYSYYSLRFPSDIALLCTQIEKELNADYIDLPFMLPVETESLKYNYANVMTFENEKYFIASKDLDVCIGSERTLDNRYFGLINITESVRRYVLWANFFDEELKKIITNFRGIKEIRIFSNPPRINATLECGDFDV